MATCFDRNVGHIYASVLRKIIYSSMLNLHVDGFNIELLAEDIIQAAYTNLKCGNSI